MSCSFCNSSFHNIRGCRDPMISLLYQTIKVIYVDIMNLYPHDAEMHFNSVLNRRFNLRELRAVCVTHTNFPASRTKPEIIDTLYQYYSSRVNNLHHQSEEQSVLESRILPTQPDPIPDFAHDLVDPQYPEAEPTINWYIDRTPLSPESVIQILQQPPSIRHNLRVPSLYDDILTREEIIEYDRNNIGINLSSHFEAVSGNIPFVPHVNKYKINPVLVLDELEEGVEDCAICYESIKCMDLVKLNCEHKFCGDCINSSLKAHNNMYCGPSCALCRTPMVSFNVKNQEIYNLVSKHCCR